MTDFRKGEFRKSSGSLQVTSNSLTCAKRPEKTHDGDKGDGVSKKQLGDSVGVCLVVLLP